MDERDRSTKLGAAAAGLGLLAVAGVFFAKRARSLKAEDSIHDSWGERSNRDRHPEIDFLPEEERETAFAEMEAIRIANGQRVLEDSLRQSRDALLAIAKNISPS